MLIEFRCADTFFNRSSTYGLVYLTFDLLLHLSTFTSLSTSFSAFPSTFILPLYCFTFYFTSQPSFYFWIFHSSFSYFTQTLNLPLYLSTSLPADLLPSFWLPGRLYLLSIKARRSLPPSTCTSSTREKRRKENVQYFFPTQTLSTYTTYRQYRMHDRQCKQTITLYYTVW